MNYPTGYIHNPKVAEYDALPESEQLITSMADTAEISTVHNGLRGVTVLPTLQIELSENSARTIKDI